MEKAISKTNGQLKHAHIHAKHDGPFICPECKEDVIHKLCNPEIRRSHYAHKVLSKCSYGSNESELHYELKYALYDVLQRLNCNPELECTLDKSRPDILAKINGISVAFEVQISNIELETFNLRNQKYTELGIYPLWLVPETIIKERHIWHQYLQMYYYGNIFVLSKYDKDIFIHAYNLVAPYGQSFTSYNIKHKKTPTALNIFADFRPITREPFHPKGKENIEVTGGNLYSLISKWYRWYA